MQLFVCQNCGNPAFFENVSCERCGSALGFQPEQMTLTALTPAEAGGWHAWVDDMSPKRIYRYCANEQHGACNWLVAENDGNDTPFCQSCRTNRYIPNLADPEEKKSWKELEFAKHRLIYSLLRLRLPIKDKLAHPREGMSFDFISQKQPLPQDAQNTTGHAGGRITIDVSEGNAAQREHFRENLNEPYRTLIGHFRHEVGHYYWDTLIAPNEPLLLEYRLVFGDERADYSQSLNQHYELGPPPDWKSQFISAYAASHPWEDWAETWAHYFHLVDTLDTACSIGLSLGGAQLKPEINALVGMTSDIDPYTHSDFEDILNKCIPLTLAVNSLNRSMGQPDLYPFVMNPGVRKKLSFIHDVIGLAQQAA